MYDLEDAHQDPGLHAVKVAAVVKRDPDWSRDSVRMHAAIVTTARMIMDYRERAIEHEERVRTYARAHGFTIDTRADRAQGSAEAYAMAGYVLAGALRVANIEEIAHADGWTRELGPAAPVVPDGVLDPGSEIDIRDHAAIDVDTIDARDGGRNDR